MIFAVVICLDDRGTAIVGRAGAAAIAERAERKNRLFMHSIWGVKGAGANGETSYCPPLAVKKGRSFDRPLVIEMCLEMGS